MRVLHGGIVIARTVVHNNNLDPEYDECVLLSLAFSPSPPLRLTAHTAGLNTSPSTRSIRPLLFRIHTDAFSSLSPHRIVYIEVHSPRDTYQIEVMDYQHLTKDRSLGSTEFSAAGLLAEGPDKRTKPWIGTGIVERKEMLKSNGKRSVKGASSFDFFLPLFLSFRRNRN